MSLLYSLGIILDDNFLCSLAIHVWFNARLLGSVWHLPVRQVSSNDCRVFTTFKCRVYVRDVCATVVMFGAKMEC